MQQFITQPETWAFVLNKIYIEAPLPFQLTSNCILHKASAEQQEKIKTQLSRLCGWPVSPHMHYEYDTVEEMLENGTDGRRFKQEPLHESDWRYYVVSSEDNGQSNINIQLASNISDLPLDLTLRFTNNGGIGFRMGSLQRYFERADCTLATNVSVDLLNDVSQIYRTIMDVAGERYEESEFPEIWRALQMYDNLILLPSFSDFHILGLFAIIEMLITHNPKLEDRGDSITHQMQSKIPLLSRRFDKNIEIENFFGDAAEKKVWAALYKYRSSLAHGGIPDFQKGELQVLKNSEVAKNFLQLVVRRLIRHCLKEPYLYRDLRAC